MSPNALSTNVSRHFGRAKDVIYEDEKCVAYDNEGRSVALIHFLVVPKTKISCLHANTVEEKKILGHMLLVAKRLALEKGLPSGYHLTVDEDYKRSILKSIHIFNRTLQHMLWPIGPGSRL